MNRPQGRYPRWRQLKTGAILYTIAHAIAMASSDALANEVSWDGDNYNRQDSMGTRGTVVFFEWGVVGVFRDDNSARAPWRTKQPYDISRFLRPMPNNVRAIALREPLRYMVDEYSGTKGPIITAAFWSEGEAIVAAEPWDVVVEHGAHLIRVELLDSEEAIPALQEAYEFSPLQVGLLRAIYDRKINAPDMPVQLSTHERETLMHAGIAGLDQCRELLASIGIRIG